MAGLVASAMYAQTPVVIPYAATPGSVTTASTSAGGNLYAGAYGTAGIANGSPTASTFEEPYGLAVDQQGNIYVGEGTVGANGGAYVRKISAITGQVSYFAGGYAKGGSATAYCALTGSDTAGNNCPATPAYLAGVRGVAVDAKGNVYIDDYSASSVRKVDAATGIITRFFGSSSGGGWSVDGLASTTAVHNPRGIAVGPDGSVYIADVGNNAVRKAYLCTSAIAAAGSAATTLGNTCPSSGAHNGLWEVVTLSDPNNGTGAPTATGACATTTGAISTMPMKSANDLAVDNQGNLYISSNGCGTIVEVAASGNSVWPGSNANVIVGKNNSGGSGTWIAKGSAIPAPVGITVDPAGDIYFGDSSGDVYFWDVNTGYSHVIATGFGTIYSMSHDAAGNLYLAGYSKDVVWWIPTNRAFATTVAGQQSAAQTITVHYPAGYTAPTNGTALVSTNDFSFGTPGSCYSASDNTTDCNVAVQFTPQSVGWIKASVQANSTNGTANGTAGYFGLSGTATGALAVVDPGTPTIMSGYAAGQLDGVAVDRAGDVYIADPKNNMVLKYAAGGTGFAPFAGTGTSGYTGDGAVATSAELSGPTAVAVDPAGNVYIADTLNNVVRQVNAVTGYISTVISSSIDSSALTSSLNDPSGLAIDANGIVYVSDTGNNVVLVFDPRWGLTHYFAGGGTTTNTNNGPCTPGSVTVLNAGKTAPAYITALDAQGDGCQPLQASLSGPTGLATGYAVDGSGYVYPVVYIADTGNNMLRVVNLETGTINQATTASISSPEGLAADTAGDLYYVDAVHETVNMIAPGSTTATTVVGQYGSGVSMGGPVGLALGASGALYVADAASNNVYAMNRLAPTINFGSQFPSTSNPATGVVTNIGNPAADTLTLSGLVQGGDLVDFTLNNETCTSATTLAPGAECDFLITFDAASPGTYSGSVTVGTSANSPVVTLSGTGASSPPTATTIGFSGSTTAGQTLMVGVIVMPPSASVITPTGTVTVYVDGVAQVPAIAVTPGSGVAGTATWSSNLLGVGQHSIYAIYSGDSNYSGSTSTPPQTVTIYGPDTTTLALSTSAAMARTSVTFTASVCSTFGTPGGSVNFSVYNAASNTTAMYGPQTLTPSGDDCSAASYTSAMLPAGTLTVTATYNPNGYYLVSTSSPQTLVITPVFTMSCTPTQFLVVYGSGTGNTSCTLTALTPTYEAVGITCAGLPAGVTCGGSGALSGTGTVIPVTVTASSSSWPAPGPYTTGLTATTQTTLTNQTPTPTNVSVKFQAYGSPANIFTVAIDGTGDFSSLQSAVNVAPSTGGTIYIKPGIYREKVIINQPSMTLVGLGVKADGVTQDPTQVVIVYNDNAAYEGGSSSSSATLYAAGTNFYAENMLFENDSQIQSGYGLGQGVAFRTNADRASLRNVYFIGEQDTLLSDGGGGCGVVTGAPNSNGAAVCKTARQYYNNCTIVGNVDYIYGDGAAVFDGCTVQSVYHSTITVTAQGQNLASFNATAGVAGYPMPYPNGTFNESGFVFTNSTIASDNTPSTQTDPLLSFADPNTPGLGDTDGLTSTYYLGRPYPEHYGNGSSVPPYGGFATVIFMNSNITANISPAGYSDWNSQGYLSDATIGFWNDTGNVPTHANGLESFALSESPDTPPNMTAAQAAKFQTTTFLGGTDGWNPTLISADQPVANPESVTTMENSPVGIVLSGSSVAPNALTYTYSQPANGTLTGTAPNLTYTPNANYFGSDSFTFKVTDPNSRAVAPYSTTSTAATVSITVQALANPILSLTCTAITYDGNAHSCTGSATGTTGAAVNGSWSFSPASEINAGSYPVTGTFTSLDTNYAGGTAMGTLVIGPAAASVTVTCPSVVYDGNAHSCTGLAAGVSGAAISGTFTFSPGSETLVGSYPETATFTSSDPNYSNGSGSGTLVITAPAALTLSTTSVTFSTAVMTGQSSSAQYLLITSTGAASLQVSSVSVGGANPGDFLVTNQAGTCATTGATLVYHAECNLRVVFAPTAVGARSAILYINDNVVGSPQQVLLSGTAVNGAQASVSATTLTFPATKVNATAAAQYLMLKSTGFQNVVVSGVSLSDPSDFLLSDQAGACIANSTNNTTTSLVPGADCNIRVQFRPKSKGSMSATLTITDNTATSPHVVTLNGTGE